jgi:hypothetical protein
MVPRTPAIALLAAALPAATAAGARGGPFELSVVDANRTLPAGTDSLGLRSDRTSAPFYLDAEGVKLTAPALF